MITNLRIKMSRSVIAPRDAYAPVERVVAPVEAAELDPPRRGREAIILPILRPSESHAVGSPRRAVGGPNARVEERYTERECIQHSVGVSHREAEIRR